MDDRERELMEFYRELIRRLMIRCCQLYYSNRYNMKKEGSAEKYFTYVIKKNTDMKEESDGIERDADRTPLLRPAEKKHGRKDRDEYLKAYV